MDEAVTGIIWQFQMRQVNSRQMLSALSRDMNINVLTDVMHRL